MPLISVLIPTRERCETLRYALKTLCAQDFSDCEFIVSDNASQDGTEAVVAEFDDPRVRYIRTPSRISMTANYNFALEHVTGDYIIIIGDDDGMTLGALAALADIIKQHKPEAVSWRTGAYYWPNHPVTEKRNLLILPVQSGAWNMSACAALRAITWGLVRWDRLPIIYHGMVKRKVIEKLREKTGMFLISELPDVYSAIAIATQIKQYALVNYPYSFHGFSASSNAAAYQFSWTKGTKQTDDNLDRFWNETAMKAPKEFSSTGLRMEGAAILESLYRVRNARLKDRLFIPFSLWLYKLAREAGSMGEPTRTESLRQVEGFAKQHYQKSIFRIIVHFFGRHLPSDRDFLVNSGNLILNGDKFDVKTIEDAMRLIYKIRRPKKITTLRSAGFLEMIKIRRATRIWMS